MIWAIMMMSTNLCHFGERHPQCRTGHLVKPASIYFQSTANDHRKHLQQWRGGRGGTQSQNVLGLERVIAYCVRLTIAHTQCSRSSTLSNKACRGCFSISSSRLCGRKHLVLRRDSNPCYRGKKPQVIGTIRTGRNLIPSSTSIIRSCRRCAHAGKVGRHGQGQNQKPAACPRQTSRFPVIRPER